MLDPPLERGSKLTAKKCVDHPNSHFHHFCTSLSRHFQMMPEKLASVYGILTAT